MIPYMIGKLAPNSSHFTRGLVKYIPGRSYFRAVPSQNGDKFVTSPPPPNRCWCKLFLLSTVLDIPRRSNYYIDDSRVIPSLEVEVSERATGRHGHHRPRSRHSRHTTELARHHLPQETSSSHTPQGQALVTRTSKSLVYSSHTEAPRPVRTLILRMVTHIARVWINRVSCQSCTWSAEQGEK